MAQMRYHRVRIESPNRQGHAGTIQLPLGHGIRVAIWYFQWKYHHGRSVRDVANQVPTQTPQTVMSNIGHRDIKNAVDQNVFQVVCNRDNIDRPNPIVVDRHDICNDLVPNVDTTMSYHNTVSVCKIHTWGVRFLRDFGYYYLHWTSEHAIASV